MPYAITEIRALGRRGHEIHAADTFDDAPGSHSRFVTRSHQTSSPRDDAEDYHAQISRIVDTYDIDLVIPAFEEVFYLARVGLTAGRKRAPIFTSKFRILERLHDKARFAELARKLGLRVPDTRLVYSRKELAQATAKLPAYFARAAFSRAGTALYTNMGPLAGTVDIEDLNPSSQNPWLVQEFVQGLDLCSFSVVREGKVLAHSTYEHPKTLDSAGGIVFESVVEPGTLEAAQRVAQAVGYHGQLSFDFMRTEQGELVMIECNPRPTAGVCVMPEDMFVDALLGPIDRPVAVAPAGTRRSIRSALLRDMFLHPDQIGSDLQEIFSTTPDVYFEQGDRWPGIYQFMSVSHVLRHWSSDPSHRGDRFALGYLHDLCWDGKEIPGPALSSASLSMRRVLDGTITGPAVSSSNLSLGRDWDEDEPPAALSSSGLTL